jgi:hypothetical protein
VSTPSTLPPPSGPPSRRPLNDVMLMPFREGPETARLLAQMALEHVAGHEIDNARRAAEDAALVVDGIEDRKAAAEVSLLLGEAFVHLHEAHRAKERLCLAASVFDEAGDLPDAARARFALGHAMLLLRDPAARAVLEDAGTIYEELGNEEAVLSIDRALRDAEAAFEESPGSFSACHGLRSPTAR